MNQIRNRAVKSPKWKLDILYEDNLILLVNKPAGIIVHPNDSEQTETLLNRVREYLRRTGSWDSNDSTAFRPMPCNRLDRFTSGIVIFAKTWDSMRIMNQKIQQREIEKNYQCIVVDCPRPRNGKIENYLLKNQDETYVTVHKRYVPKSQYACTEYRTVAVLEVGWLFYFFLFKRCRYIKLFER